MVNRDAPIEFNPALQLGLKYFFITYSVVNMREILITLIILRLPVQPNPLCPVAYHLDRLLSPIADSMRFSKNIYTPTEGMYY